MKKIPCKILCIFLLFAILIPSAGCSKGGDECIDGQCEIPTFDENGDQVYPIVSPVGYHDLEMLQQAPRLSTLEGKTVALVGGSFMASTTHPELKKCILESYPTAKVYTLQEVGSGGPYSVFGQSAKTRAFQEKLKELGVDAVVSGNCGCGLCTVKEAGSAIAAEYLGIPSVTVGAPTFIAQIRSTGVNRGVPVLRTAEYPGAFASHSTKQLLKHTRETLFPQIVKALTEPITEEEIALSAADGKRPYDETVYYGSYGEIQDFCKACGWTDGLPVVPPTDGAVRRYLEFTPYEADEILGTYPPSYRECTVYTAVVNAVMAGVPAEFTPLCIAMVQAMENGEWRRPLASTHGWSPYAWLNGPLARQLGIDRGQGMISEEPNKALGRFLDLAMLNIGGYYVKENRMGTFGYLSAWTFSEDEEACLRVGWDPYHVTQGYGINDNTLTAASALQWGGNVTPSTTDAEQIANLLAWDITEKQQNGLGNTNPQVYRTVFITENVAKSLSAAYPSKEALEEDLIQKARRPLYLRTYANYWANTGSRQDGKYSFEEYYSKLKADPDELAALTDTPPWLAGLTDDGQIETIATMRKGQTPLLITGDPDRNKFQVMPGGGYVTVEIRLPENWDALVAPLGYQPLKNYLLQESDAKRPAPSAPQSDAVISVPSEWKDGTYRLVPSEKQLTEAGRLYRGAESVSFWPVGAKTPVNADLPEGKFGSLLSALGYNCSFRVEKGTVTQITLRMSTVEKKPNADLSALDSALLGRIPLSFSLTAKQSKEAGGVTPDGTSLTLSSSLTRLTLDLGGQTQLSEDSTPDFAKIDGNTMILSPDAENGSVAKLGIKKNGGKATLILRKKSTSAIEILYKES